MSNYFKTLAGDLLQLEVSTILVENTTNEKMPSSRRKALLDIADSYRNKLAELGFICYADGSYEEKAKFRLKDPLKLQWWYGGEFSFVEILHTCQFILEKIDERLPQLSRQEHIQELRSIRKLVERFAANSSGIIGMFKKRRAFYQKQIENNEDGFSTERVVAGMIQNKYASQLFSKGWNNDLSLSDINRVEDMELSPEEITLIRKVWEIGTQQVLLQTVIQIDGDITSYIATPLLEMNQYLQSIILNIHNDAVATSTRSWSALFNTIMSIAGKTFDRIFKSK
ncbi:MAG: hypothetical protein NZM38_06075 [Cytophagales bacterium]|nr:hypothetical protein [Cytophagales bacterium]MDW8384323.1 hypothetical protein [Flammeovirgaceae bacterium]